MLNPIQSFSGFSIKDIAETKQFYRDILGLKVSEEGPGLRIQHVGGGSVIAYVKDDHEPATFTILNYVVNDIDAAVKELGKRGIQFEKYDNMPQDKLGILRGLAHGYGPDIAWLKDPSGNLLSVLQEQ